MKGAVCISGEQCNPEVSRSLISAKVPIFSGVQVCLSLSLCEEMQPSVTSDLAATTTLRSILCTSLPGASPTPRSACSVSQSSSHTKCRSSVRHRSPVRRLVEYDRSDANSETSLGAELYNVMVQCSSEIDRLEMNESEKSQVKGTGQRYCAGCLTSVNPPKEVGAYAGADLDSSRIRQASEVPFVPPSLHDARPWSSRPLSPNKVHDHITNSIAHYG